MCLAAFAIEAHPDWPLVVVANRDEFHARPTQPMQPWPEMPGILAGRDLQAGGTWLGIDTEARLALLTNVRDPKNVKHHAPSRGALTEGFLRSGCNAQHYLQSIAKDASSYNGFNLIAIDTNHSAWHASNYQQPFAKPIGQGIHGLSNALLDTPWPKTARTAQALSECLSLGSALDVDLLCNIMLDTTPVDDHLLPDTGLSLSRERLLSTPFIVSPDYGTRCMTVVLRHISGACWVQEDTYDPLGQRTHRLRWHLIPGGRWQATQLDLGNFITT